MNVRPGAAASGAALTGARSGWHNTKCHLINIYGPKTAAQPAAPGTYLRVPQADRGRQICNPMSLILCKSNRMEKLVERLVSRILEAPLSSPFVPEVIVVETQGMAQWLKLELAKAI
ncbi:MAG: exodeoxyribonuclease V subunit gamma, partial [Verrucomicrobia bacterium]|nr:exodeoxyribonuclease V subunit gamma [Verrucomicrobiota bacterium]